MTGVAMSNQDGMTSIAEGVADYRQTQLYAIADQLEDDPDNAQLINELNADAGRCGAPRRSPPRSPARHEIDDALQTPTSSASP